MIISSEIKRIRKSKKISQTEMGKALGISYVRYGTAERSGLLKELQIEKALEFLGCEIIIK
jgi:transcriptional regulator with XRE-family HTH domain